MTDDELDALYARAHTKALEHFVACQEAAVDEEDGMFGRFPEMAAPYCGCDTCIVREILHAAKKELLAIVRAEA